jgi:hypothetical protein
LFLIIGHHTSACKYNGNWYFFDYKNVSELENPYFNSNLQILFYKKTSCSNIIVDHVKEREKEENCFLEYINSTLTLPKKRL